MAEQRSSPGWLALLAAAGWLSVVWNLPLELYDFRLPVLASIALEVAIVLAALALLPWLRQGRLARPLRWVLGLATTLWLALALAELLIRTSLGRPLNPLLDLHLAWSLAELLSGAVGGWPTLLLAVGLGALLALVAAASAQAVGVAQRALERPAARAAVLGLAAFLVLLLGAQWALPGLFAHYRPAGINATNTLRGQIERSAATIAARPAFARAVADDPFRDRLGLLSGLEGTDVLLVYVESYGRSALEQPRYAATLGPRLEDFEQKLAAAGLVAASGRLTSPIAGGQSWLAHGTIQSGIRLAHQYDYDLLVRSERLTLAKAFAAAGHRPIAVKPAITRPWLEGASFGFARIYAAADLGYRGPPYSWVTMPDQFTLATVERLERQSDGPPLFAEVSLISSHAPWTPLPPLLDDWSTIGDGAIYARLAADGDPPEVVWRDPERVRRQYVLAIDYVLGVLAAYAERFVDDRTLLIIVGDHQPAPLITGPDAGRDVPMHVISGDRTLIAPFLDWGFTPGMRPSPERPARPMDSFRDWFLTAFSGPAEAAAASAASRDLR